VKLLQKMYHQSCWIFFASEAEDLSFYHPENIFGVSIFAAVGYLIFRDRYEEAVDIIHFQVGHEGHVTCYLFLPWSGTGALSSRRGSMKAALDTG